LFAARLVDNLLKYFAGVAQNERLILACLLFSSVRLVADDFVTTEGVRIGNVATDNPARRLHCYRRATEKRIESTR
jgi:hypothetical protein